jgi:hypothetical protein
MKIKLQIKPAHGFIALHFYIPKKKSTNCEKIILVCLSDGHYRINYATNTQRLSKIFYPHILFL